MAESSGGNAMLTPREVFRLQHERVLAYDMDGQADLFAEDGVLEFPFAPAGVPRRLIGRVQIRAALKPVIDHVRSSAHKLYGSESHVIHETLDPEVIIVEFELVGDLGAAGTEYRLPYIQIFRVRNGEIVSLRDYWTSETAEVVKSSLGAPEVGATEGTD